MQARSMLFFLLAAGAALAADPAYLGKWKFNPTKSDYAGTTLTFAALPSGEWECGFTGQTYRFKMDGKEYPVLGQTAAWKAIDGSTWQTAWKANGRDIGTDTVKLGADGSTLTITTKGVKPNGDPIGETDSYQRVSGGPGLVGTWKTTTVKDTSPGTVEFAASGSDGLTFRSLSNQYSCDFKLDGKDYPCSGGVIPPGWTVAGARTGTRSLDLTLKKDGKVTIKRSYTVAADGKTMTQIASAPGTNEKMKVVYDRQ